MWDKIYIYSCLLNSKADSCADYDLAVSIKIKSFISKIQPKLSDNAEFF